MHPDHRLSAPVPHRELLDDRVLKLLVFRSLEAKRRGFGFPGLSAHNIVRMLGMPSGSGEFRKETLKAIGEVRAALNILRRGGLAYYVARSRKRWHPTSKGIVAEAFLTEARQLRIDDFGTPNTTPRC